MDDHDEKWIRAELARVESTIQTRLRAMDQALELATDQNKINLEHLNEVRQTFVSKEIFQTTMNKIDAESKTRWLAVIGWILALGIGIAGFLKGN